MGEINPATGKRVPDASSRRKRPMEIDEDKMRWIEVTHWTMTADISTSMTEASSVGENSRTFTASARAFQGLRSNDEVGREEEN